MKILTLGLALFLGCAHAKDPGSAANLVQSMTGKSPKEMCSDGTWSVTLRSYSGKYCNDKSVCDMMKSNCFPGGSDPYKALQSGCAKMCKKTFGNDYFKSSASSSNSQSSNSKGQNASSSSKDAQINKDYATLGLAPGATCADVNKNYKQAAVKNHPDKGGNTEQMQEINNAKDNLKKELNCLK
jgi:hypothetical protein